MRRFSGVEVLRCGGSQVLRCGGSGRDGRMQGVSHFQPFMVNGMHLYSAFLLMEHSTCFKDECLTSTHSHTNAGATIYGGSLGTP